MILTCTATKAKTASSPAAGTRRRCAAGPSLGQSCSAPIGRQGAGEEGEGGEHPQLHIAAHIAGDIGQQAESHQGAKGGVELPEQALLGLQPGQAKQEPQPAARLDNEIAHWTPVRTR